MDKDGTAMTSPPKSPPLPQLTASPTPLSPQNPPPTLVPTSSTAPSTNISSLPPSSSSKSTLQTSRPAPASPANSRPSSQLLGPSRDRSASTASTSSSTGLTAASASGSKKKSRPRSSLGLASILPDQTHDPNQLPDPITRVTIRDYAFEPADERYHGRGRVVSVATTEQQSDTEPEDERKGWGAGGRGGFGLLGWRRFITKRAGSPDQGGEGEDEGEDEEDEVDDDYAFSSGSDEGDGEGGIEPLGIHRAVFAFEPMGASEMALEEGDLIDVRGRGGGPGNGWVVAVRVKWEEEKWVKEEQEGLVPENYLEKVE
ncbi:hypothetical protein P7C73_g3548, partial [Tremellales sp. Uapishka_1]